ncbi:hypothetical protein D3C77_535790 [compost metagenome]
MRSHEAVTQGAGHAGQLAFLWQQQGDLGQRLAGQFLELDQRQRQLHCGWVLWILFAPVVDGCLLLLQRAGTFYCQGQAGPAGERTGASAGSLQLIAGQGGDQIPDGVVIGAGCVTAEQWCQVDACLGGGESLAVGFQDAGLHAACAALLFVR